MADSATRAESTEEQPLLPRRRFPGTPGHQPLRSSAKSRSWGPPDVEAESKAAGCRSTPLCTVPWGPRT
ncbi:hypothetical protein GUJ93_ZPchr0002g26177 [Zizania palustris]|uniref:Uncharacterized protein n=1 Tax=Zizania palustris TaxID=103762 RepID=A0A8J5S5M3_ZIZPA|nr:hypothetical protein GUJ93_ZPchr0002g26177 [Zizania palustris]